MIKGYLKAKKESISIILIDLKFGDSDGPNLCRVNKVDVISTFYSILNFFLKIA